MTFNSSYCSYHPTRWNSTEHSKSSRQITQGMRGSSMGILLKATPRFFHRLQQKERSDPLHRVHHEAHDIPVTDIAPVLFARVLLLTTNVLESTGVYQRASEVKRPPVTLVEWLSMLRDISSGDSDRNATTVMVSWFQDSDEADLNFPPVWRLFGRIDDEGGGVGVDDFWSREEGRKEFAISSSGSKSEREEEDSYMGSAIIYFIYSILSNDRQ